MPAIAVARGAELGVDEDAAELPVGWKEAPGLEEEAPPVVTGWGKH